MKLYVLRHGEADWEEWTRPDDERPLTKKGRKEAKRVAEFMVEHDVVPDIILTSPLPRAYETAEIVAKALDAEVTEDPNLSPGFDTAHLTTLLRDHAGQDLLIVGHEPSLSEAIATLTGGSVRLAKAGLALVDLQDPNTLHGELVWLMPPKFTKT